MKIWSYFFLYICIVTRKKEIEFKASARGIRFRDDLLVDGVDRKIAEIYSVIAQSKFKEGAEWADSHAWKPADGDDLPEIDREVVVFTQDFPNDEDIMKVSMAHRPNPNGDAICYDKGGWNQPNVRWWLDIEIPQTNKKEEEV